MAIYPSTFLVAHCYWALNNPCVREKEKVFTVMANKIRRTVYYYYFQLSLQVASQLLFMN